MLHFIQNQLSKVSINYYKLKHSLTFLFHIRWGKTKEKIALNQFEKLLRKEEVHHGITLQKTGLRISTAYPFLAASCVFLFECPCPECAPFDGLGVGEIKCSWTHKDELVYAAARSDRNFPVEIDCDTGELKLKENHSYYYQMQVQMNVTRRQFGFLVLYSTVDLKYVKVMYNPFFFDKLLFQARNFFVYVILPELVTKYYTRKFKAIDVDDLPQCDDDNQMYLPCFCQTVDENQQTLRCSNEDCLVKYFHIACILIKFNVKCLPRVFTCLACKRDAAKKLRAEKKGKENNKPKK